jgi:superfamily II DNA or RNA helicase|tara:strand:+ start:44 stop:2110 length:2067 start_codon:yes stop_codon:yes gene_type:complete
MSEDAKNKIRSLKRNWDTDQDDRFGEDFTSPCIEYSTLYRRQSGDFSSHVIKVLKTSTVKNLIETEENQCRIKILTHPTLTEEDKTTLENVLRQGRDIKDFLEKIMERSVEKYLYKNEPHLDKQTRLDIFAQLVAKKNILIKFAFSKNPRSLFHKKQGIFTFPWGDKLYHIGGENFSVGGLEINNEHFCTFQSWHERDLEVIEENEKLFEKAWEGKSTKYVTKKLNQKTLDMIIARAPPKFKKKFDKVIVIRKNQKPDSIVTKYDENKDIQSPKSIEDYLEVTEEKWRFQERARLKFIKEKRGILEMATGTGKTRTALAILTQLINENKINKIIIQMKGNELLAQWEDNIKTWLNSKIDNQVNLLIYTHKKNQSSDFLLNFDNPEIDLILVSQHNLENLLKKINEHNLEKTIIIHDEVHDLFAPKIREKVIGKQKKFEYKLGLSATAREEYDKPRERILFSEVGEIIFEYPLEKAIRDGVLVEMDLITLNYELDEDDKAKMQSIHAEYNKNLEEGVPRYLAEQDRNMDLADVYKNAKNKIPVFENEFSKISNKLKRSFIFADECEYVDEILNSLSHKRLNVRSHTGSSDYRNIEKFSNLEIDCLINCTKLSQGIDVKSVNTIVLFATPKGRQLIQRLGRVLRIDDKNFPKKRACIIDFCNTRHWREKRGSEYDRYIFLQNLTKIKKEK